MLGVLIYILEYPFSNTHPFCKSLLLFFQVVLLKLPVFYLFFNQANPEEHICHHTYAIHMHMLLYMYICCYICTYVDYICTYVAIHMSYIYICYYTYYMLLHVYIFAIHVHMFIHMLLYIWYIYKYVAKLKHRQFFESKIEVYADTENFHLD